MKGVLKVPEPKTYKAKLIDQITDRDKSKQIYTELHDKIGTLYIRADNRISFHSEEVDGIMTTSELQAVPVTRGNEMIFVTRNSTYVFEILEEADKSV
jgi:hypothetical protein